MVVRYRTEQLRKVCEDASIAGKKYGDAMAEKIQMRIEQLQAAESVEMLVSWHIGRCHPLQGNRKGQYAMDLTHPYRLIFEKVNEQIIAVKVLEIVDYH